MANPFYWFPCEPSPLLGALAGMRPSEGYIYTVVLLRIYESGGLCKDTIDCIATRTKFNRKVVTDALESLFKAGRLYRDDDGIRNPKADGIISSTNGDFQKRKTHSKNAAISRWRKHKQKQQNDHARAMPNDAESELQLKKEEDSPLVPPLGETRTRKRIAKGFVLPSDWKPKDSHYAKGAQLGFGRAQIDGFAERMRNWAGANAHRQVARKSNWDLAFHNWISDKAERRVNEQPNGGSNETARRSHPKQGRTFAAFAAELRYGAAGTDAGASAADCQPTDGHRNPEGGVIPLETPR